MKELRWIGHEIRLQWKNGFYVVYFLVNVVYVLMLGYVPEQYQEFVGGLLLISDPTFLGMIFVGGILLLENNQGIPKGIGVSPLGSRGYILGKVVSLLIIALITGISIIITADMGCVGYKMIAIVLGGSLFTMLGIIIGSYATGINPFIGLIAGASIVLSLPLLSFYGVLPWWLFGWIPTYSIMTLMMGSRVTIEGIGIHTVYLLILCMAMYKLTQKVVEARIFVR